MKMKKATALLAALSLALPLTACSGSDPDAEQADKQGTDLSAVTADQALTDSLPENIKSAGVLKVVTSPDYEPAEFLSADGKTFLGYDIDIINAVAKKLNLKTEFSQAPFESIIPAVGSKYDVAISSFDVSPERLAQVNMSTYMKSGSLFMVQKENPKKFDPANLCGMKMGAQSGSSQQQYLENAAKTCASESKPALEVLPEADAQMLATKLAGGQLDAIMVDNIAAGFTASKNPNKFQTVGDVVESSEAGIITAKDQQQLAEAITKATQALIDDGTMANIFKHWNVDQSSVIKQAVLNPGQ
ncbi:ABC transporter substrate-binding protein [Boudabousia liubingyangii]|nr:ABC transporter substrate-binding protein [Boudabousia liubingyangii]